jgi:hypothetical protein
MNYQKRFPDSDASLMITDDNRATVEMDDIAPVTVQLASEAEAKQMIAEFEDPEGDLMHEEGSIFGKYPQLHPFRP